MSTPRDEDLRERERQLADSQRVAQVGSFEWVPATGQVDGTDEMYRIYGIERPATPPRIEAFLHFVHRDDHDRVAGILSDVLTAGQPFHLEHRIVRPGGEVRVVEQRGEVVLEETRSGRGPPASTTILPSRWSWKPSTASSSGCSAYLRGSPRRPLSVDEVRTAGDGKEARALRSEGPQRGAEPS